MDYRPLGRTDIKVSSITLGTMTFGQQNTEAEGHAQLDYALERGINFIDTAEMYSIPPRPETQGSTERIIGTWLKARGNRSKVILATKVSGRSQNTWLRAANTPARPDAANIREAIDASLKRLQTDYIDLYQVHWPDRAIPLFGSATPSERDEAPEVTIEETLAALGELVKAGKVRHIGVSNEASWGLHRYLRGADNNIGPRIVSNQNAYNLLNRIYETDLAEFALREQVGLLAYSPLAQGYLTGKYQRGARPAGARSTLFNRGQRYEKPGVEETVDNYLALARDIGWTPVQLAQSFVTTRPFVTTNIIGATSLEQLKENIDAAELALPADVEARINALHQLHGNPCP